MKKNLFRSVSTAVVIMGSLGAFTAPLSLQAQKIEVPRPDAKDEKPMSPVRYFDSQHLKDRPYAFNLPKPTFPSSERVQREFVVEYLYDYAYSTYTPEVALPIVADTEYKRDTPENALIAMFSAMRTGNFDGWVKAWDEPNQKELLKAAKEKKQDAAFWKALWKSVFVDAKSVQLVDRVETATSYVILDIRMPGTNMTHIPTTFKLVQGEWLATNELSVNPIMYQFRPTLAGIVNPVPPVEVSKLDKENTLMTKAQQRFLNEHTTRDRVIQAGP